MFDNMIDDILQSATSSSFDDNMKNFDVITDGGWFENPLGDPSTYTGLKNDLDLNEITEDNTERILHGSSIEESNDFFYSDSYGGDAFKDTDTVHIQDVHDYEISVEETSSPDGCRNIKIAALVIGVLVAFLAVWLIVSAYLNTNQVVCDKSTPFCPPCPVCPANYNEDIVNNTRQFYIRDRISHHSIFNLAGEYISNFKGDDGIRFMYNEQSKILSTQPDNLYVYVSTEGGYLKIKGKDDIDWEQNTCYFNLEGKELTAIFPNENRKLYVIVYENFLAAVEEELYQELPYQQRIAIFKDNPNILQGIL